MYKYFDHISAVFAKKTHLENFALQSRAASDNIPNHRKQVAMISRLEAPSTIKYIISLSEIKSTLKNLELAYKNITEYENELSRYF